VTGEGLKDDNHGLGGWSLVGAKLVAALRQSRIALSWCGVR
jgi:hypothetical protein